MEMMTKTEAEALWKFASDDERRIVRNAMHGHSTSVREAIQFSKSGDNYKHWVRIVVLIRAADVILGGDGRLGQ